MIRIACTVYFEDPFWVAVLERTDEDGYFCVAKTTFGAEPTAHEVLAFIQTRYGELSFSAPVAPEAEVAVPGIASAAERISPKRRIREAARAVEHTGIGTRSQQALKAQYEAGKTAHRAQSREARQAEAERRFQLRQEKKKEKHRGR